MANIWNYLNVFITNLWTNCMYQLNVCSPTRHVDFDLNQVNQTLIILQLPHKIECSTFILIEGKKWKSEASIQHVSEKKKSYFH